MTAVVGGRPGACGNSVDTRAPFDHVIGYPVDQLSSIWSLAVSVIYRELSS